MAGQPGTRHRALPEGPLLTIAVGALCGVAIGAARGALRRRDRRGRRGGSVGAAGGRDTAFDESRRAGGRPEHDQRAARSHAARHHAGS